MNGQSAARLLRILLAIALTVGAVGHPTALLAQETQTLPPAESVPLYSTVDVRTLQTPSLAAPTTQPATPVKPFLTPDPEGLRQWREFLQQNPGALPPASGFTEDAAPQVAVPVPLAPAVLLQFDGLANADNAALTVPPDDNLGVGPNNIVEMVNSVGRISSKAGGTVLSFNLGNFFGVDFLYNGADPTVIYDAISGRWFAVYLEYSEFLGSSSLLLAVSTTSDPTGLFCVYHLGNPAFEGFLQDFPRLGVSDDKVVVSYNGFAFPLSSHVFVGAGYYALNKANMLACASASFVRAAPDPSRSTPTPPSPSGARATCT